MKATLEPPGVQTGAGSRDPRSPARSFEKILIVRLGSMGDIIHSLPAVATLRRAFPQARIDWVVEERWAELLCSRPELRGVPRSPEKPLGEVLTAHARVREHPDAARPEQLTRGIYCDFESVLRIDRWRIALDDI